MKASVLVRLLIDVDTIPTESNQLALLSAGQRALLLEALIKSRSLFQAELRSVLGGKLDVKFSTHIGLPGLPDLDVGNGDVTIGAMSDVRSTFGSDRSSSKPIRRQQTGESQ